MRRAICAVVVLAACGPTIQVGSNTPSTDGGGSGEAGPPPGALRMFMTASAFSGNLAAAGGVSSGLVGADAVCALTARAAGLSGDFFAFLSDDDTDAIDRVSDDGPWYGMDGVLLFPNKAALTTSLSSQAMIKDERGGYGSARGAWTGTNNGGRRATATCKGWTAESGYGVVGKGVGSDWVNDASQYSGALMCEEKAAVFCIERSAEGSGALLARKRVFSTSRTFKGDLAAQTSQSDGFAGGDALCVSAAQGAKLGGTWKAWLSGKNGSGTSVQASDRLADVGPWYLVDRNTRVFENKAALSRAPVHAIDHDEFGHLIQVTSNYDTSDEVWIGFDSYCCGGWTDQRGGGAYGRATTAEGWQGDTSVTECNVGLRLYCFEQ